MELDELRNQKMTIEYKKREWVDILTGLYDKIRQYKENENATVLQK